MQHCRDSRASGRQTAVFQSTEGWNRATSRAPSPDVRPNLLFCLGLKPEQPGFHDNSGFDAATQSLIHIPSASETSPDCPNSNHQQTKQSVPV